MIRIVAVAAKLTFRLCSKRAGRHGLCGRDGVQFARGQQPDFNYAALANRWWANAYLVRWQDGELTGTIFKDGRVMIQGTTDGASARACADRALGLVLGQ